MNEQKDAVLLVRKVRQIADVGIVNARDDRKTLHEAADLLEALDERVAIMSEFPGDTSSEPLARPTFPTSSGPSGHLPKMGKAGRGRLLAAEELRDVYNDGGVYWVEYKRRRCHPCVIGEIAGEGNFRIAFVVTIRGHMDVPSYHSHMANYGKSWRCWSAQPTEEQLQETPWAVDRDDYDEHRHSGLIEEE